MRKHLPNIAELINRLAIDQIKEALTHDQRETVAQEIADIEHDLDLLLKDIPLTARLLRKVILLAQINLHIWHHKDEMQKHKFGDGYSANLDKAHQWNGIRNQISNSLLDDANDAGLRKGNTETDGMRVEISL